MVPGFATGGCKSNPSAAAERQQRAMVTATIPHSTSPHGYSYRWKGEAEAHDFHSQARPGKSYRENVLEDCRGRGGLAALDRRSHHPGYFVCVQSRLAHETIPLKAARMRSPDVRAGGGGISLDHVVVAAGQV